VNLQETAELDSQTPLGPAQWQARGHAFQSVKQYSQALTCYQQAEKEIKNSAALLTSIATCLERLDQHAQAHQYYQAALAIDPALSGIYHGLLSYQNLPLDHVGLVKLKAKAENPRLDHSSRSSAEFALGRIYLAAGETKTAFAHYLAGNSLLPHVKKSGALAVPDWKRLARVNAGFLSRFQGWPDNKTSYCPAVIVAGLPRAGKSLTERLLARLPGVMAGGELALVNKFISEQEKRQPSFDTLAQKLAYTEVSSLARRYEEVIQKADLPDAKWVTDTSPANIYRLGLFSLAYPRTPIIFCERDFLDLGISIFFKKFRRGHQYSYNLSTLGATIAVVERLMDHWQQVLPNPMLRIRYEDLVTRPYDTVDRLAEFLGQPLSPDDKQQRFADLFQRVEGQICHPSHAMNQLQGITPNMIGFAKPFEKELEPMKVSYAIMRQQIR